jgi:hypothetical protein
MSATRALRSNRCQEQTASSGTSICPPSTAAAPAERALRMPRVDCLVEIDNRTLSSESVTGRRMPLGLSQFLMTSEHVSTWVVTSA